MIAAVIFDLDGLLIDSEPFWKEAELEVFLNVGAPFREEMCDETVGVRIDDVVALRHRQFRWDLKRFPLKRVEIDVVDGVVSRIRARGKAMPGVENILYALREQKIPMAVASSSCKAIIEAAVTTLNIRHYFQLLQSAEDHIYGKPHPSIYLKTAEMMDVPARHCLVFEDSVIGVIAAKAASMKCIAVPEPRLLKDPRFAIADEVIAGLDEFRGFPSNDNGPFA